MKTLILAAIRCSLMFLVPSATYGISAQWDLDPISGDWNTADNWTPMGSQRPSGHCDIRSFEYDRCLDFREHRGQRHHVHPGRYESLHHHCQPRIDAYV